MQVNKWVKRVVTFIACAEFVGIRVKKLKHRNNWYDSECLASSGKTLCECSRGNVDGLKYGNEWT